MAGSSVYVEVIPGPDSEKCKAQRHDDVYPEVTQDWALAIALTLAPVKERHREHALDR